MFQKGPVERMGRLVDRLLDDEMQAAMEGIVAQR